MRRIPGPQATRNAVRFSPPRQAPSIATRIALPRTPSSLEGGPTHEAQHGPYPHHPRRQPAAAGRPRQMLAARDRRELSDMAAFEARVASGIAEVVRQQTDAGIDVVNDGEWSKPDYSTYVKDRFTGFEGEPTPQDPSRDMLRVPGVRALSPRRRPDDHRPAQVQRAHRLEGLRCRQARHRQPQGRDREQRRCRGLHDRRLARPGGALPGQRLLQERRGVPLGPRQRPQGRVQGDRRRRLHPPARLPRPRLRLEQPVSRPHPRRVPEGRRHAPRGRSTPRRRTSRPTACASTSAGATTKAPTTTTSP